MDKKKLQNTSSQCNGLEDTQHTSQTICITVGFLKLQSYNDMIAQNI